MPLKFVSYPTFKKRIAFFPTVFLPNADSRRAAAFYEKVMHDFKGKTVLDIGTGCGIGALFAAHYGASVTATDINPFAVFNTRFNAYRLGLSKNIRVIQTNADEDVYAKLAPGARFDRIISNPPFFKGERRTSQDQFAMDPGHRVIKSLIAGLRERLTPEGKAYLIYLSDDSGLKQLTADAGLTCGVCEVLQSPFASPQEAAALSQRIRERGGNYPDLSARDVVLYEISPHI